MIQAPPTYPALYQVNTRVWLTERSRTPGPAGHAGRHSGRGPGWHSRHGVRLDLAPQRVAHGRGRAAGVAGEPRSGGRSSRRRCPTSARRTSPAPASPSPATRCTRASAATRRWPGCASAFARAGCGSCSTSSRITPRWITPGSRAHPEYYVPGTEADLARAPQNYTWVKRRQGHRLLAHGRDPYFPGWPDTLQLDYGNPATQEAMSDELVKISGQCDGVRCDMAMLVLPDVFERTWGRRAPPFWPRATRRVRERVPGLLLHGRGLLGPRVDDAAAGVRLRVRQAALRPPARGARAAGARALPGRARLPGPGSPASWRTTTSRAPRRRFRPASTRRRRSSRTCRRACGSSTRDSSRAGGSASRRTSSGRPWSRPTRPSAASTSALLGGAPAADRSGTASGGCSSARRPGTATGPGTASSPLPGRDRTAGALLVAVNYAPNQGQCYVRLPFGTWAGRPVRLRDLTGPAVYDRAGDDLRARGLYLDVPAMGLPRLRAGRRVMTTMRSQARLDRRYPHPRPMARVRARCGRRSCSCSRDAAAATSPRPCSGGNPSRRTRSGRRS